MAGSEKTQDPVKRELGGKYEVTDWDERSRLDAVASSLHTGLTGVAKWLVVLVALVLFLGQMGLVLYALAARPGLGVLTLASMVPAFVLVGIIWYGDPTMREPVWTLSVTFLLAVLFASFAATANSALQPLVTALPFVGMVGFFFLVVAPVEETVKWLAIRSYAYNTDDFDAVVDGAVYGAVAGLGFASIENALYISKVLIEAGTLQASQPTTAAIGTATQRAFVGPGHVLYSAIAGYYLGLAKFANDHWGPIVVKGLLVAAVVHATYNSLTALLPFGAFGGVVSVVAFLGFVLAFDGLVGYFLYRKISRYRAAYKRVSA
ncbi:PrsW family intramembrane metalloprotease [Haloarchaeobius sp. DFWS5]|uniref:PrsW family intramembrane metalloprotease n=1 Tax=Haloarchaeobius sp. DFWS5 TaxID=3446114 RepID=UPI003EBBF773